MNQIKKKNNDHFIHNLIDQFLLLHITVTSKCETQTCTLMKLSHGSALPSPSTDEHVTQ